MDELSVFKTIKIVNEFFEIIFEEFLTKSNIFRKRCVIFILIWQEFKPINRFICSKHNIQSFSGCIQKESCSAEDRPIA